MFIEIPILLTKREESDVDYESLGIPDPTEIEFIEQVIINAFDISRVNRVEDETYKTTVFIMSQEDAGYKCMMEYEELKEKLIEATNE